MPPSPSTPNHFLLSPPFCRYAAVTFTGTDRLARRLIYSLYYCRPRSLARLLLPSLARLHTHTHTTCCWSGPSASLNRLPLITILYSSFVSPLLSCLLYPHSPSLPTPPSPLPSSILTVTALPSPPLPLIHWCLAELILLAAACDVDADGSSSGLEVES